MRRLRVNWLVGAALAAAAMVSVQGAFAADASAGSTGASGASGATGDKSDQPEEKIFRLNFDGVVGSARVNTVTGVIPPGTTAGYPGLTTETTARVTDISFIVDGGLKVSSGFGLGFRLPLLGGVLFANPSRSDGGIGNLELSGAGRLNLAKDLDLELTLGVTLPTAGGHEVPPTAAQVPVVQGAIDQSGYDRYSVLRATSFSRGLEDDELFQQNYLGINPKIRLIAGKAGKWHLDPWIKLDDLIATNTSYSFIGELLFGANLGVFIVPEVEPVLRIWANVPLTNNTDYNSAVAVIEPDIKFHIGDVTPYVGGILPIAGPIFNPYAYGVRFGVGGVF
jgi:hypothetical protein